ncbi:adenylate/guanylate cyclase domain-containing protein [Mesorhizobium sp. BAC0120]|uniref:adenylate/guanylate cyclase domain-containing protein n=1 Tax=Mesorhizobium sp. BAC0120 TaxID=3090670 RepID=UPI00298C75D3|nr:adenylate/guanylate cyclase domain-containing protein [Mesorhizobium sp. BAC0120]MDW6024349.1 adenylate/guanylate cyclase domain-containing protein [Mesorhizobium sp. BAC0120]
MNIDFFPNLAGPVRWPPGYGRVADIAKRVRDFGIEGYPPATQRRLRQVNVLNAFVLASYLVFAAFYALFDWSALKLLAFALLVNVPLLLVPPFLHRYSEIAAITWIAVQNALAFVVFGLIVGSAAGMQFWLLAAGVLIVFYGTDRLPMAVAMICLLVGTFLFVEFELPRFSEWSPITPAVAGVIKTIAVIGSATISTGFVYLAMYMARQAEAALETEYARSEALLSSIMPDKIAARLKREPQSIIADKYDQVTLLFADVVNFTPKASLLTPEELVAFLNRIFSSFDALAEQHGLEKIKTIGDAYMVAGGLPEAQPEQVATAANMALDMLETVRDLSDEIGEEVSVRIGIHTGPAVAGVLGKRKLFYDVWGDTVNTAARMEAFGSPGRIQVTEAVYMLLDGAYAFEQRGVIDIKGKGPMAVYYLLRAHGDA